MNDEEHIINYILRTQEYWKHRNFKRKKKKWKSENVDKYIYFCLNCNNLWEKVENFISKKRYVVYFKEIMPTIGKKHKNCPKCEVKNG